MSGLSWAQMALDEQRARWAAMTRNERETAWAAMSPEEQEAMSRAVILALGDTLLAVGATILDTVLAVGEALKRRGDKPR